MYMYRFFSPTPHERGCQRYRSIDFKDEVSAVTSQLFLPALSRNDEICHCVNK